MKKLISLTVCLIILATWAYGQIEFSLYYDYSLRSMKLKEEAVVSEEGYVHQQWWVREKLIEFSGAKEAINGLFLKISYSPFSWLKMYGITGINTMKSEFDKLRSLVTLYLVEEPLWDFPAIERKGVKGKSKFGLSIGGGLDFSIYKNDGFQLILKAEYLYRENDIEMLLVDEGETWLHGGGYIDWERKFIVNELKSQEFIAILEVSKNMGKVTISGAPLLFFWSETEYVGKSKYRYTKIYVPEPSASLFYTNKMDFSFKAENCYRMGIVFTVSYALENADFFIQTQTQFEARITAGIKFRV